MRRRSRRSRGNPTPRAWKGRSSRGYSCNAKHLYTKVRYRGASWKVVGCAAPRKCRSSTSGRCTPNRGQYVLGRGEQGGGRRHTVPKSVVRSAVYRNRLRKLGRLALCPSWKSEKVGPKGLTFPHRAGSISGCTYARGGARGPKPRVTTPRKRGAGFAWAMAQPTAGKRRSSKSVPWSSAATPTGLPVEHVIANPGRGYRLEARGHWGGSVGGWRPAITGTLNQTGRSDAWASTFTSRREAEKIARDWLAGNVEWRVVPAGGRR